MNSVPPDPDAGSARGNGALHHFSRMCHELRRVNACVRMENVCANASIVDSQDVYFYFFNPMWKIRKYQVQGTQRFWEDVDQIVKVSTHQIIALRRSRALRGP